jgi:SOS-response transcriptional repressor LexA
MATWSKRIKSRMKELGMTQDVLANKMGITRGAITHYLAGRRQPPLHQFQKLAAILKIDPAWLQYGLEAKTKDIKRTTAPKGEKIEAAKFSIPILSWEQAAEFTSVLKIAQNEITEFVPNFYIDKANWYALRIKGDSMVAPQGGTKSFNERDIIIVDPDRIAAHGNYVISILPRSKEATFKQFVIDGGIRYLKPLNPQYPLVQIDESMHICGVVIESLCPLT